MCLKKAKNKHKMLKGYVGTVREVWDICDLTSSNHHNSGGLHVKKKIKAKSQLHALATHTAILGASLKATWSYVCHKLGSAIFLVTLACLDVSSKKSCL